MVPLVPTYHTPLSANFPVHIPVFPDASRLTGIHITGAPGTGKSFLLGQGVVFDDFIRGIPQVVFDVPGSTIVTMIDMLSRIAPDFERRWWEQYRRPLPPEWVRYLDAVQALFTKRLVYADMSGKESVMPFPLYYRLSTDESLVEIAQRFIEVIMRMDPDQVRAPVEGMSSIERIGRNVGMIIAALGLQITEVPELIEHPEWWHRRFEVALAAYPEVEPAITALKKFASNKPEFRVRRSDAFLTKIDMILKDPSLRAIFGAARPGIDWQQVVDQKQTVLLDFRKISSTEQLRFSLLWVFLYLMTFLKQRGAAGRMAPVGVVIDELSVLLGFAANQQALLAEDIRLLLEVVGRNYGCWITLAHQNLSQILDPAILNALMQMGTQCIGRVTNPAEAEYLARFFYKYDPYLVKKTENVWMKMDPLPILTSFGTPPFSVPRVIDTRTVEYTVEEQRILSSHHFLDLRKLQFLTRISVTEGDRAGDVHLMDLNSADPRRYLTEEQLTETRRRLAERSGFSKEQILAEIEQRTLKRPTKKQVKLPKEPATLNTINGTPDTATPAVAAVPVVSAAPEVSQQRVSHEEVWQ